MDTLSAFARGQAAKNNELKVFDWDRAAQRIRETSAVSASAGLAGDWDWTGGTIYASGEPSSEYTYLASTWATPELELTLPDGDVVTEDCYRMEWYIQGTAPAPHPRNLGPPVYPEAVSGGGGIRTREASTVAFLRSRLGSHYSD